MGRLARLQAAGTRVVWASTYPWRLDIMRKFDPVHFQEFHRECNASSRNLSIIIRDSNRKLASHNRIHILSLDRMASLLITYTTAQCCAVKIEIKPSST